MPFRCPRVFSLPEAVDASALYRNTTILGEHWNTEGGTQACRLRPGLEPPDDRRTLWPRLPIRISGTLPGKMTRFYIPAGVNRLGIRGDSVVVRECVDSSRVAARSPDLIHQRHPMVYRGDWSTHRVLERQIRKCQIRKTPLRRAYVA